MTAVDPDVRPSPAIPADPLAGRALSQICPYLVADDGTWRSSTVAREHRCAAVAPPALVAAEKQRRLCLTADHATCSTYEAALAARPMAPDRPPTLPRPVARDDAGHPRPRPDGHHDAGHPGRTVDRSSGTGHPDGPRLRLDRRGQAVWRGREHAGGRSGRVADGPGHCGRESGVRFGATDDGSDPRAVRGSGRLSGVLGRSRQLRLAGRRDGSTGHPDLQGQVRATRSSGSPPSSARPRRRSPSSTTSPTRQTCGSGRSSRSPDRPTGAGCGRGSVNPGRPRSAETQR